MYVVVLAKFEHKCGYNSNHKLMQHNIMHSVHKGHVCIKLEDILMISVHKLS